VFSLRKSMGSLQPHSERNANLQQNSLTSVFGAEISLNFICGGEAGEGERSETPGQQGSRWSSELEPGAQVSLRKLAHSTLADRAVGADQDREGQAAGHIAEPPRQPRALQAGQRDGEGDRRALQESAHRTGLVDRQAQHLPAVGRMLTEECV